MNMVSRSSLEKSEQAYLAFKKIHPEIMAQAEQYPRRMKADEAILVQAKIIYTRLQDHGHGVIDLRPAQVA